MNRWVEGVATRVRSLSEPIQWGLLFLAVGIVYANPVREMAQDWYLDPNYSHGFLIPLIAGYFLWTRRDRLRSAVRRPCNWGLGILAGGLGLFILADLAAESFTMRLSLLVVLAGLVLFLAGMEVFRVVAFPLGYLVFMIPLPYVVYDAVAFPLKLFAAKTATAILQFMAIPIHREGNILILENTTLEVADACSGIRSLMSLLALAVAYAHVTQQTWPQRFVLVAAAVPIAIAVNVFRVVGTGLLTHYAGPKAAMGFFHEFEGVAVFALALVLLFGTGWILNRIAVWRAR